MILNLEQFIEREQPFWTELDAMLETQREDRGKRLSLEEARRYHYLYQRASSDLVKLKTFAGEASTASFLENLVAEAYSRLHEHRGESRTRFSIAYWLMTVVPTTFRRRWKSFALSIGISIFGALFAAALMTVDEDSKGSFIPPQFSHLFGDPSDRVEKDEAAEFDGFEGRQRFSAELMQNNISVSIKAMVLGITWGVFTVVILFYNGIILGAVGHDYILAGEGEFLAAWLLPHGSVELPAIFIGGQAGLIIARSMFGWGTNLRMRQRFARIRGDLITLICFAALLLVWAGLVESFVSQYHAAQFRPWKIAFGSVQLAALVWYLGMAGRKSAKGDLES